MKNQFCILLVLVSLIFTTSCNNDDDNPLPQSSPFIGTWNLSSVSSSLITRPVTTCDEKAKLEFTENQFTATSFNTSPLQSCVIDEKDIGSYTYTDNSLVINTSILNYPIDTIDYHFENINTLVLTGEGEYNGQILILNLNFIKE